MSENNKRGAPDDSDNPEAKRPAPAACTWGSGPATAPAAACSWGSGGGGGSNGGCSWGSGASTSFASIASSGTGFGAVAASAPATGFGAFSGATTFAPKNRDPSPAAAPRAASVPSAECPTPTEEAPSTVEAAVTGEEDETCVHRVRAKLFRLEVRMEVVRPAERHPEAPDVAGCGGEAEGKGAEDAAEAADESAKSDAATTAPPAVPSADAAKASSLNPEAKAFVPAAASSTGGEGEGAAAAGGQKEEKRAGKEEEEGGGDEDEDEDEDGKPAAEPEEPSGELEEVTRWAERGVGQLRLLVPKHAGGSGSGGGAGPAYPRLVMRVEHVGRLILNESLLPSMAPAERVSDTSIRLVVVSAGTGPQSYLLRVKTPVEAEQLIEWINKTRPAEAK